MSLPKGSLEFAMILALSADTAQSVVNLLLMESFMMGMLCASVPLGSYIIWSKLHSASRASCFVASWITLIALITHWALSLQHFESVIQARILLPLVDDVAFGFNANETSQWFTYGPVWQFVLPLVTETVLFGFSTVLFAILAYTIFRRRPSRSQWNTLSGSIIPILALIMYTTSLAHWTVSVRCYLHVRDTQTARSGDFILAYFEVIQSERRSLLALSILLSANVVLSDAIVLWRMCIVWNNRRLAIAFGALLIVTILALNIVSLRALALISAHDVLYGFLSTGTTTWNDVTQYAASLTNPYRANAFGLAAALISLASNLCATVLVGMKAWLYRMQIGDHVRSTSRRTAAERLLELLVDSGTLYTAIWVLYCVSFFRPITSYVIIDIEVTAVDHLNAAMAQITTIYPLMIFIFMVLDKTHHSRGPRALRESEWSEVDKNDNAEMVALDMDAERRATLIPHSTVTLNYDF